MLQNDLHISADPSLLDLDFINGFITESYWAKGRTKEEMRRCMDHSLNFGIYLKGKQIGFARVVTDTVQFAYLMDVFIDPAYRGKGYSMVLLDHVFDHPELKYIRVWRLASTDAQWLYEKYGFGPLQHPEKLMEKLRTK